MLRIHHPPQGELTVSHFDVSINGKPTIPWYCRVSAVPFNTVWPGFQRPIEQTEIASFISFEMQEPVELRLKAWKSFSEVVVRPLSRKIHPTVNGREIAFCISEPGAYTVELDGMNSALHKRADGCHQRIFRKDVIDRATQLIHEDNVIDFVAECAARIQTQESTMLPVLEAKSRKVKKSLLPDLIWKQALRFMRLTLCAIISSSIVRH